VQASADAGQDVQTGPAGMQFVVDQDEQFLDRAGDPVGGAMPELGHATANTFTSTTAAGEVYPAWLNPSCLPGDNPEHCGP
jgi:hypothetical protein